MKHNVTVRGVTGVFCVIVLLHIIILRILLSVRKAAPCEPVYGVGAESLHTCFDILADIPLRAVTHACVQLLRLRDGVHVGYHPAALLCAPLPSEKFPAVEQIILHSQAAGRIRLALQAGLRAAHGAGPRQARFDGLLCAPADGIQGAVAVLQSRAALGSVELDQRGYAVAGALLTLPADDRGAGIQVLVVSVMTIRVSVALQDGFPADQTAVVVGRSGTETEEQDQYGANPNRCPLHQSSTICSSQDLI